MALLYSSSDHHHIFMKTINTKLLMKDGFEVEFTSYEGKMTKEVATASFILYNAYRSFALCAQKIDITN